MKIFRSRLFKVLVLLFILGIVLGIISYYLLDKNNNLINYFNLLESDNYSYINYLIKTILYNYKYSFIIWISGIIIFISFTIPIIVILRGIITSYTIINIFYIFKLKGLIISLILLFPCVLINELVYLLLSYYSINFSFKTYKAIKHNKSINIKSYIKNYFYILVISFIILLISSIFDTYISSNLIKFVI